MSNIEYILATKQITSLRKLEVIANNVANANTNGYKSDETDFASYMVGDKYDKTAFAKIRGNTTDFSNGAFKKTDNALDVALNGNGFFIVRTPNGDMLTRNGSFSINTEGMLVNQKGFSVLTNDNQQIIFDAEDKSPIIGDDGTIFVGNDARGRLGVVEVPDNNKNLQKVGDNLWKSNVAFVDAENAKVSQGMVEDSNVNGIRDIASLAELQRETTSVTNLLNESLALQRTAFKAYSKMGG